ncbi:tetratricopeptide repeat protein [Actinomadura graeca]|uniref:Tetratricopeptide repeat protein n=1 Tax=Actinomadura graeca TaxID=2750812 RepID=A0ABX8R432_9ACTN|nr:tetratricopeptide repeat protein [Actinomadura graeca]QXJ25831.1 tetratricopeptide repeat protein [Actinomadura graeca]
MLGVAASVGAGVPPLVVPAGWPLVWRALIAAVVAGLAGASGSYFGVVLTRTEDAAGAREALEAALEPLDAPRPGWAAAEGEEAGGDARRVLEVLVPQWCPTAFWGRRAELDRWWQWCQDQAASALLMLEGPGGCGKTRLALRAAGQVAGDGWVTGWLGQGKAAQVLDAAASVDEGRVLVLVDDADTRSDLGALLEAVAGYRGRARLRVMLITRNGAGLVQALAGQLPERHSALLTRAGVMSLGPLGGTGDLVRWYGEAVRAFAADRDAPAPPVSATVAPVRAGQTLMQMLAEALTAVLRAAPAAAPSPVPSAEPTPADEVARVLFEHEARWWRATAELRRWGLTDVTDVLLARLMVALVLFAPEGEQAAVEVVRRIPDLADAPGERVANLVRWARTLYPPGAAAEVRIGPDVLTDWFVTTHLTGTDDGRDLARALLAGLSQEQAGRVLTVLARAGEDHPPARTLFEQVLDRDPVRLAHHAVHAALTSLRRRDLDHATATALARADLDPDTTARLTALIPAYVLPRCAVALARRHLHHTRTTANPPALARALTGLTSALFGVGEHDEQLRVAEEAVGLCRELAADDSAHRPALARALTGLTSALFGVGEHDEQLRVAEEAVGLCRELAADDSAHRPALARALTGLTSALGYVGEHDEQLRVAREAVGLFRELAADNPAHRPDLAHTLTGLAAALDRLGELDEQLRVAEEAVGLCRELAADDSAHRPALARALTGLAAALDQLGEHDEARRVAREAVGLCRELAADNPAHRPALAHALTGLAAALDYVGEREELLRVVREAVGLCRELAADNRAHRPRLAHALTNLAVIPDQAGEHDEQLRVAEEAVGLFRELAADNSTYQPVLAHALTNLAAVLDQAGEHDEFLRVAREAVGLFRELAADNPAHRPRLAHALIGLTSALDRVGGYDEALRVDREAVELYRDLAARYPKRFHQLYIETRGDLQRRLVRRGDDDAIALDM